MENREIGQYDNAFYRRTVDLQRRCMNGMTAEHLYRREALFAITAAQPVFQAGEKILDIACGEGDHARILQEATGVPVEARDLSPVLIEQAQQKNVDVTRANTAAAIHFATGDMFSIQGSVEPGDTFRMITCLGDSLLYTESEEELSSAFRDYGSLLEKGGSLVLQFRAGRSATPRISYEEAVAQQEKARKQMKVAVEHRAAQGPAGHIGTRVSAGTSIMILRDQKTREGCYVYEADLPAPKKVGYQQEADFCYKDPHGILHERFGRVFIDEHGHEHDLGIARAAHWLAPDTFPYIKKLLLQAGFASAELREDPQPISADGAQGIFAVVART